MVELKPMDVGEILDGAMTIYRRHFGLLLRVGVIALWLPSCLTVFVQLTGGAQQHIGLYFFTAVIQYFGGLFLTVGAIRIISDSYLGQPTTVGQAVSLGVKKMFPLWGVAIGKGLLLGLIGGLSAGVAALAIPLLAAGGGGLAIGMGIALFGGAAWGTIFVACGYAVTTQVVVLEALDGAFDSFGRSWELTRGLKRKVALVAFVAFIIFYVPILGVGAAAGALSLADPGQSKVLAVVLALLPIVLTPLLACVFTLLYYDLRIRREGFDLQVLSQQLVSS